MNRIYTVALEQRRHCELMPKRTELLVNIIDEHSYETHKLVIATMENGSLFNEINKTREIIC